jgi:hypothetical protein
MTRAQVKHVFDLLLAEYQGTESEVIVHAIVVLNACGKSFEGAAVFDAASGLLVVDGHVFIRAEQVAAIDARSVTATTS